MNTETQENRIRLVLLDELGLFRGSLSRFLAADAGFEVAGECGVAAEALEILKRSVVDVVLLDFDVRSETGDDFMSAARLSGYEGHFLIMTAQMDARKSAMALKSGASGIFLKSEAPARLIQTIRLVADGELWIDPRIIRLLADESIGRGSHFGARAATQPLRDREQKVLHGILGGLSNRKIADNMGLSESSIKNVVQQLFAKNGVRTRSQLVRIALEGSMPIDTSLINEMKSSESAKSHQLLQPVAAISANRHSQDK